MKPLNLKFKIATPRKATVTAVTLENAVDLNIRIKGISSDIDNTKLKRVVRELTNDPENGFEPNKFIATVHNTPKRAKINVTLLFHAEMTKERIITTAMNIMEEL